MQKAGFIGLGIMGKPMAANLLKNGVALAAFTRSGVPDDLIQAGAVACDSPAAVAAQADVIFIMVPDTPDVERVLFGEQRSRRIVAHGPNRRRHELDFADGHPRVRGPRARDAARTIWMRRFPAAKSAPRPAR